MNKAVQSLPFKAVTDLHAAISTITNQKSLFLGTVSGYCAWFAHVVIALIPMLFFLCIQSMSSHIITM